MTLARTTAAAFTTAILLARPSVAQQNPPPWWRVADEVTVSLAWDFDNSAAPGTPTLAVVPSWHSFAVTQMTTSSNVAWIGTLSGHTGVIGLVGTGAPTSAAIELVVDNDPHIDWIKIFWFQFDAFEGTSGEVAARIEQDLVKYGRGSMQRRTESIGNNWERTTIQARLIPQPTDEKLSWALIENAVGTVAIDNLFVSSKCVKPGDEKGRALGDVDGFAIDLLAATGAADCRAAAVTEGPGPGFPRTYWVASRSTIVGALHQVFQLSQTGSLVAVTQLPATVGQAPEGPQDLAVENAQVAPGVFQEFVYALVDRRPSGGQVELVAIDETGALAPARDLTLVGFPPIPSPPPPMQFGLAFDPSGDLGAGTFWVSDPIGAAAYEFSRSGATTGLVIETRPIPPGIVGLGYDAAFGHFLGFGQLPQPAFGFGVSQVNGYEWSGYDFQPTGVEFQGDLRIPNLGGPPGGLAQGLEVYRRGHTDLRMVAVARLPATNRSMLYEMAGPFRFGHSLFGECGMRGGPAFEGSPTFEVTLKGVPDAVVAVLYAGFDNDTYLGLPLPGPLAVLGMPESYVSISLDVTLGAFTPSAPGEFSHAIGLPPGGGLSYVPLFFQWLLLDPTVPGLLATSQAGKTVAY